jgi:hypothetical protein
MAKAIARHATASMVALAMVAAAVGACGRHSTDDRPGVEQSSASAPGSAMSDNDIRSLSLDTAANAGDANPSRIEYVRGQFSVLQPFMQDPLGPITKSTNPDYARFPHAILIEMQGTFMLTSVPGPNMAGASAPTGPVAFSIVDETTQDWLAGGIIDNWADLSRVGPPVDLK